MKFWVDFSGGAGALPALWESLRELSSWKSAFEEASQSTLGLPFEQVFLEYASWNAFACGREDGHHYDLNTLPCIIDVSVPLQDIAEGDFAITHEAGPYTASYYRFAGAGLVEVSCETTQGSGQLRLMGISADGEAWDQRSGRLELDQGVTLRTQRAVSGAGEHLLLATSLGELSLEASCTLNGAPFFDEAPRGTGCAVGGGASGVGWGLAFILLFLRARYPRGSAAP
jgi:hypothetical protein